MQNGDRVRVIKPGHFNGMEGAVTGFMPDRPNRPWVVDLGTKYPNGVLFAESELEVIKPEVPVNYTVTTIPAGYRLHIESYENDGDATKTEILEGVKREHIPFLVEVLKLLRSEATDEPGCYGNMYSPDEDDPRVEELDEALEGLIAKYPDRPKNWDSTEQVFEELYDLGLTGGEYHTRAFESLKIEYVPQDVVLEDVTDEFYTP